LAFAILYVSKKKNVLRAERCHMQWMWNAYKGRFTTNTKYKLFQKNKNLKGYEMLLNVQGKFQWKFKENVFECVECDFNRICDLLVNHVMTFKRAYWMHKSWLVFQNLCPMICSVILCWMLKVKFMISNVFIGIL